MASRRLSPSTAEANREDTGAERAMLIKGLNIVNLGYRAGSASVNTGKSGLLWWKFAKNKLPFMALTPKNMAAATKIKRTTKLRVEEFIKLIDCSGL